MKVANYVKWWSKTGKTNDGHDDGKIKHGWRYELLSEKHLGLYLLVISVLLQLKLNYWMLIDITKNKIKLVKPQCISI